MENSVKKLCKTQFVIKKTPSRLYFFRHLWVHLGSFRQMKKNGRIGVALSRSKIQEK